MNIKYGHRAGWVEKAIIVFFILWGMATVCKVAGAGAYAIASHTPSTGIHRVVVHHHTAEARGEGNKGMYAVAAVIAHASIRA